MASNAERALADLESAVGGEAGVGEWHTLDQSQIDRFADATLDHQFIHVDPERAARSRLGGTVAHGFLTLSLVVHLSRSIPTRRPGDYPGLSMSLNYGLDRVRFPCPVRVDSRVRARREVLGARLRGRDSVLLERRITVEIEGEAKPACVADLLTLLVFDQGSEAIPDGAAG